MSRCRRGVVQAGVAGRLVWYQRVMAQRTIVLMTDDLDGESEAVQTVSFSLDGTGYEIDLTDKHAQELRDAFNPYVSAARSAVGPRRAKASGRQRAGASSAKEGTPSPEAVRAWARDSGMKVSERGRISGEVMRAYEAEH